MKYGIQGVLFDMAVFAYCNELNCFQLGTILGFKVAKQKVEDTCTKMCENACKRCNTGEFDTHRG